MPSIRSVGTALPQVRYDNEEIIRAARIWLDGNPTESALFERFLASGQTETRHFVHPLEKILLLSGMKERSEIFERDGVALGLASLRSACETARMDPSVFDTLIFTSCSSPVIPSIDAALIAELPLDRSITRVPIYQHGCAGGVVGLALANKFAKLGSKVLLTSVELCSLGFQHNDHSAGHLVGSAIFGDGSASVVVTPEDSGLVFLDSQSVLTQNSHHMMGYDILDDGAHLRLNKELPGFLAQQIPDILPSFLGRHGLTTSDIRWWLFHPGGVKILNCLESAFAIEPSAACWAREVLRDVGNLSSASILFVTSEFLKSEVYRDRDLVLMVGVGPGLTVEMILFEMRLAPKAEAMS